MTVARSGYLVVERSLAVSVCSRLVIGVAGYVLARLCGVAVFVFILRGFLRLPIVLRNER
jgi:hypothetical protein